MDIAWLLTASVMQDVLLIVLHVLRPLFVQHVLVDSLLTQLEFVYLVYLIVEYAQVQLKLFVYNVVLDSIYLHQEAVLLVLIIA
jgi:hypothetical protein